MKDNTGNRTCYIRKNNLITGPFSVITLKARINTGSLKGEDMVSYDKVTWERLDVLFPHLAPPVPERKIAPGSAPAASPEAVLPQEGNDAFQEYREQMVLSGEEEVRELQPLKPFARFCCDLSMVFASVWDFPLLFAFLEWNKKRILWMSLGVNLFWALVMVLLFGREYSPRFSYFFSPLMAVISVLTAAGLSAGFAWSVEKICSKRTGRTSLNKDWQVFGAAVFMDSAMILNTFLGLGHGFSQPLKLYFFLFMLLTVSLAVTGGISQLRFYLEHTAKIKNERVLFIFPLYGAVTAAVSYFLLKLI